jgi:hypothetical protein
MEGAEERRGAREVYMDMAAVAAAASFLAARSARSRYRCRRTLGASEQGHCEQDLLTFRVNARRRRSRRRRRGKKEEERKEEEEEDEEDIQCRSSASSQQSPPCLVSALLLLGVAAQVEFESRS